MIKKVLIANRGEIALRVMRSCREMGLLTVAVFSDADRTSHHVAYADEAYPIGPAVAKESYLNIEKVIATAKRCGADAIHPGYGFLSENSEFARRCKEEGIIFIGPAAETMEAMGDKIAARKRMIAAGVPVVPGTEQPLQSAEEAVRICNEIGYPVMLKASMGGGGKGMRLIHNESEVVEAYNTARSESMSSFGDDTVYLEKFVEEPHHIEFQILGDNHGNVIHLFDRECSVQRRNQKVVEESPSPFLTPELRREMGEKAVAAAKAVNYSGAGTIEFLVDKNRRFYFLEMNTRLQVEHPHHGRGGRRRPGERANPYCQRRGVAPQAGGPVPARSCHRVPHLCRRYGKQLHAVSRCHQATDGTERNRCAHRQLCVRRL